LIYRITHEMKLLGSPKAIVIGAAVLAGVGFGVALGASATQGLSRTSTNHSSAVPISADPVSPAPEPRYDPIAYETGRSMASAMETATLAGCETLAPIFRAGCRNFVFESRSLQPGQGGSD
jgi:hypothetical protein